MHILADDIICKFRKLISSDIYYATIKDIICIQVELNIWKSKLIRTSIKILVSSRKQNTLIYICHHILKIINFWYFILLNIIDTISHG